MFLIQFREYKFKGILGYFAEKKSLITEGKWWQNSHSGDKPLQLTWTTSNFLDVVFVNCNSTVVAILNTALILPDFWINYFSISLRFLVPAMQALLPSPHPPHSRSECRSARRGKVSHAYFEQVSVVEGEFYKLAPHYNFRFRSMRPVKITSW